MLTPKVISIGSMPTAHPSAVRPAPSAPRDVAVLGLGRDAHVAFNEPGAHADDGVRRVALHPSTIAAAAADFGGLDRVPREALTVGLRTLLGARELLMLVSGPAKAEALRDMLEADQG